jgi:hypothetical protein
MCDRTVKKAEGVRASSCSSYNVPNVTPTMHSFSIFRTMAVTVGEVTRLYVSIYISFLEVKKEELHQLHDGNIDDRMLELMGAKKYKYIFNDIVPSA